MPNPNQMQEEAAELQTLQQIDQLAKSGDPNALPQISQLVEQMIQAQQAEMKELQGGDGQQMPQEKSSGMDRLKAALMKRQQMHSGQQPAETAE